MTRLELDPDLERLGDALRAGATIDLAREERAARPSGAGRGDRADAEFATRAGGARSRRRPRILAGGTLGLAGVGAALVLALSAGGATAPPAFAVTKSADGSVLVKLGNVLEVPAAERELAAMGANEWFDPTIARGAAATSDPVNCTSAPGASGASGPPVKVLLGTDGTGTVPSGDTGAGSWHLVGCSVHSGTFPGPGNAGNTGAG